MQRSFCSLLVDPVQRQPLTLDTSQPAESCEVVEGHLRAANGTAYAIRNGIPRFVAIADTGQIQTKDTFGFLWKTQTTFSSREATGVYAQWLIENYGFGDLETCARYFASRRKILDLGCGRGYASAFWLESPQWTGQGAWIGVDISEAVDVAHQRLGSIANTHFAQADALALPFADGTFDTIVSQGVLHHTPSTREALLSGARVLAPGGEFLFYVYRRKGPLREFADDYIRKQIAPLSDEAAWEAMRSLTSLGKALAELKITVTVPEAVPLLGIPAGEFDVQRLVYWNFAKLYWNPALPFEENVHVNFDWYRPQYAHRQSAEEVKAWCAEAGLTLQRFHEQESGFSVRAMKA